MQLDTQVILSNLSVKCYSEACNTLSILLFFWHFCLLLSKMIILKIQTPVLPEVIFPKDSFHTFKKLSFDFDYYYIKTNHGEDLQDKYVQSIHPPPQVETKHKTTKKSSSFRPNSLFWFLLILWIFVPSRNYSGPIKTYK